MFCDFKRKSFHLFQAFCVFITQNSLNLRNVLLVIIIIIAIITISTYIEKIALKGADKNKIKVFTQKGV